jgi:hypothetical protein
MAIKDLIRTSGDHHIQAKSDVILETQYDNGNNGTVFIYGNLFVQGTTTEIQSNDLSIGDRILVLNKGEVGINGQPGILTEGIAGLRIQRFGGDGADMLTIATTSADWLFDEGSAWTNESGTQLTGLWKATVGGSGWGILANAIRTGTNSTNLSLLGAENANAVITVQGTNNYETRVLHDDHIRNKKFVMDAIGLATDRRLIKLNYVNLNGVTINDDTTRIELTGPAVPGFQTGEYGTEEKQAQFWIDDTQFMTLYAAKLDVGQIQIKNANEISLNATDTKLILSTNPSSYTTGKVNSDIEIKAPMSMVIDRIYDIPLTESNRIKLYAKDPGPGGTGIFFVNSVNVRDEIPSKRRAFFASLMF